MEINKELARVREDLSKARGVDRNQLSRDERAGVNRMEMTLAVRAEFLGRLQHRAAS